jgi:glycolate oxidase FAD binding subunit
MSSDLATSQVRPMNVADLSAVLSRAAADGQSVGVCGAGTKIARPDQPFDLEVTTASMGRIVEHAAGDLVVTAGAGATLAALQDHVAPAGQWLALDPPEPGATLGGIVAAAASGPRRLRYGTPRDLLIGITVVLADGTIAHSGGKVVKNVAGYDLGKLFTGSFGTLGVIAECTFRLHPLPPACRVVACPTADPATAADRILATGATPTALEWDGTELIAVFESIESAADEQAADAVTAAGGSVTDELPAGFGEHPSGVVTLKVTHRLGALREALADIGELRRFPQVRAHVGSGVVWAGVDAIDAGELESLREAVARYDGQVVVTRAPADLRRTLDVWGPARGIEVMRRVKDQFDPDHRMSPGTFVGGL